MPNPYVSPLRVDVADGAQHAASTTETIICPNFSFAANDSRLYQGASFRLTLGFDVSNVVTTPGTITFAIRWGGVAGTILAQTSAIQMDTTARANFSGLMEAWIVWRSIGSAGSAFTQGVVFLNNVADAAAAAPQYFTMGSAGANVPAVVGSLDTTTAKDLAVSADFSVATAGTQITNHIRILEAISS
jgi:hypothetical protein